MKEEDVDETEFMAVFFAKLQSAPYADVSKEDTFPEWLLDKINEIETINSKDISIVTVQLFQCKWNNQFFYYIRNNLLSCLLCEVYDENGNKVVWPETKNPDDKYSFYSFCNTSNNWKIIYEFGDMHFYSNFN
jgi:hypothetical protein